MACQVDNRQRRLRVSPRRLVLAAERALRAVGRPRARLEILVVGDRAIREVNARFRGVRRPTDVIAFPLEVPGAAGGLVGQVVLSADTARRQARRVGVSPWTELDLLVTHGVLHCVGYDDRDPVEARLMHERERAILSGDGRRPPTRLWAGLLPG